MAYSQIIPLSNRPSILVSVQPGPGHEVIWIEQATSAVIEHQTNALVFSIDDLDKVASVLTELRDFLKPKSLTSHQRQQKNRLESELGRLRR
jgi:hypothetical protein